MKKLYWLTCLLVTLAVVAEAQSFYSVRMDRSLIAVGGLNNSTYYGDLKDDTDIIDVKPSLSLGLMTAIDKRFSARAEFSWITMSGADAQSKDMGKTDRNLSFTSNNYELSVTGIVNLIPARGGRFYQRDNFNAYAFAGVGGLYFNPKSKIEW